MYMLISSVVLVCYSVLIKRIIIMKGLLIVGLLFLFVAIVCAITLAFVNKENKYYDLLICGRDIFSIASFVIFWWFIYCVLA